MNRNHILNKEEYDDLINELHECSNIFLTRIYEYKEMLKINPGAYNDTGEDLRIYDEVLNEIKLNELLEKQHHNVININNHFENEYASLQKEIDEIIELALLGTVFTAMLGIILYFVFGIFEQCGGKC